MSNSDRSRIGVYDHRVVEAKWRQWWEENETYKVANPGEPGFDSTKPKCFVLDMFPYPSGAGLHVGHPVGYCATDIYSRFKRMRGYNVLHPIGFDAFGLPAEQYAIEHGVHPADTTTKNIDNMRRQLKMFGFSYDWSREIVTCEPDYYQHTQWIFLRLFQSWFDRRMQKARPIVELEEMLATGELAVTSGLTVSFDSDVNDRVVWGELSETDREKVIASERLAFIGDVAVNWCPALGTVLSNEEVTNEGRSERGDHPVFRRPLRQWMLRITRYGDRLLEDLEEVDWPEPIKLMQRNWIGRSTGAEVDFPIESGSPDAPTIDGFQTWAVHQKRGFASSPDENVIRIYTTRPDTLFGATYLVLAPEHPLVERLTTPDRRSAVDQYVEHARNRSDMDRMADTKEKTGEFLGAYAFNPVSGERLPIWVADYVLMGYGTGAIMAVPGGDTRDFEFAKAMDLEIRAVVKPTEAWAESVARTGKGSLKEIREAAVKTIRESVSRWEADPSGDGPSQRIERAKSYLDSSDIERDLSAESICELYVNAPYVFDEPFVDEGVAIQSSAADTVWSEAGCVLDGLPTADAKTRIIDWLADRGLGRGAVNYKLRDWLFSRQRYWGEPFPVLHDGDRIVALRDDELPVELPEMTDFRPETSDEDSQDMPRPPLARATEWTSVGRDGAEMRRDLNTMPQWAGSCWYYLRYLDPHNSGRFCDEVAEKYWMPVDLYVGGAEHAVLHLLYARFWHKVLFDLGYVSTKEPFGKLINQGMIQAFAFRDPSGRTLRNDQVEDRGPDGFVIKETGQQATQVVAKMSKALKNVVNPDDIIDEFGADTFRMYEMFMGPIEASKPWNTRDVPGLLKLLQRVWRLVVDEETGKLSSAVTDNKPSDDVNRLLHKSIKSITEDIEQFKFNTAIATMFEFVNVMTGESERPREALSAFVRMLSPFAPHIAEELWERLGQTGSVSHAVWPEHDESLAKDESIEVPVQVCGKVRSRVTVPADCDEKGMEAAALADEKIQQEIAGKTVRKVIVVKGRLVNIVAT